eukprot:6179218-Prymnesium_polylepis.1
MGAPHNATRGGRGSGREKGCAEKVWGCLPHLGEEEGAALKLFCEARILEVLPTRGRLVERPVRLRLRLVLVVQPLQHLRLRAWEGERVSRVGREVRARERESKQGETDSSLRARKRE